MTPYYVHIDRGVIDSNRKHGTNLPPVTIRRGKTGKSRKAHHVLLPAGTELIYEPAGILNCGARAVIKCPVEPEVVR